MNIADYFKNLSQMTLNLRYKLYRETEDTTCWERLVGEKVHLRNHQVRAILEGEEVPEPKVQERIAEWCGCGVDDLGSAPMYPADREGMKKANLSFLLDSLPHGAKTDLAKKIRVQPSQVTRWHGGKQQPHDSNLRDMLRYFALDPDTDLGSVPLFLVNFPIHGEARKKWLVKTIQEMPSAKLDPHFESIRKLLSPE